MSWPESSLFDELLHSALDPRLRHAALVHLPVAVSLLGVPCALLLAWTRGRSRALRWGTVALYTAMTVAALLAQQSGAQSLARLGSATEEARALLARHEWLARRVWWLSALTAAAAAGTALAARPRLALGALGLCVACALSAAAWVGLVGHYGGSAVYLHGAGIERPARAEQPAAALDARASAFRREVWPILERSCLGCHGPGSFAAGGLDLTTAAGVLGGGARGPAVVPGDARASLLLRAVDGSDPELRMPLSSAPLSADEVDALRAWIDLGAVWGP